MQTQTNNSLFPCDACGEMVPVSAEVCPHCDAEIDDGETGEIFYTECWVAPVAPGK